MSAPAAAEAAPEEGSRAADEESRRLLGRLRLASWLLPAMIALLLPALYVVNSLHSLRSALQIEARQLADTLSEHASREPDLWLYKLNARVSELERVRLRGKAAGIQLSDDKARELAAVGETAGPMRLSERALVMDSGAHVATVDLHADALSVLRETAVPAAGGIALGLATWWLIVAVGALVRRLQQARGDAYDARAASRAKSQFLATMSHEIRTPMNGVLGMNELLLGSPLNAVQTEWAQAVQSSGQHLLGVINDILDFSKIESGHLELEQVDFSLDEAVEKAVAMFAQPAEAKGLELSVQFKPHDASFAVRGDALRLSQVLANLIGNAVKFTEEGEVTVRVELTAQTEGEVGVRIAVQDTGIGIAPDVQERIFEQFAQADGSTTRRHGGTGLGLAISRRLLALMGGNLKVESAPGRGAEFIVELRLPRARQPLSTAPVGDALEGLRVLVVDDNQTNRDILQHQLQGWGMHVRCADSGAQALGMIDASAAAGRRFDLAVLDMHMPKMDGLELAKAIQSSTVRAATRLVMLSSTYCNAGSQARQEAGLLRFLNKPVRRAELQRALAEAASGNASPSDLPAPAAQRRGPTGAPLLHGRVLLVEDNPINQGVAKAMLAKMGLQVSVADDGAQGVARVREASFDLVLMDCQMPVMDGFEATAAIRALPGGRGLSLPIVAVTANAIHGDEQACLDAGMNGFLAKPYTLAAMHAVLSQWLPQAAEPPLAASLGEPTPAVDCAVEAINPKAIAVLRELDEPGSDALVTQLVNSFLGSAEGTLAQAIEAWNAGETKPLVRAVHTLKSSAANLGAEELAACYCEIEKRAREGRLDDANRLFETARAEQLRAMTALRELLKAPA